MHLKSALLLPVALILESLRRRASPEAAEKEHLLAGREPAELTTELVALGRRLGVEVKVAD
jgi:hypothetical protein